MSNLVKRTLLSAAALCFVLSIVPSTYSISAFAQTSEGSNPPALPSATPAQTSSPQQLEKWRKGMRQVPPPHKGCFTSAYPNARWQEVPCTTAPVHPYPPRRGPRPDIVGNGNDLSAGVTGSISEATGSFDSVTGVTSETGQVNGTGRQIANTFSLQLNSNFFSGSPACNGAAKPSSCQAWQQFVYSNSGVAFIQYWLLGYNTTCPPGWNTSSSGGGIDCWENGANSVSVPPQPISNLVNLSLTGQAATGGNDTISMSTGSNLYTAQNSDSTLSLAQGWQDAEFNIVGDCCGSQATFNSGATLVVRTSVNSGNLNAPSCLGEGFTGETNNLNFAAAPGAVQKTLPAIVFTESSSGGAPSACAAATVVPGIVPLGSDKLAATHDFNGDAKSDIVWRDSAGDVGLWLMNGAQVLQGAAFSSVATNWSIVGQRDFNGDGKSDILWRDSAGDVGLWLMNGTQVIQGRSFGSVPLNWSIAGTGDFNGDGKADILWVDNQGNVGIWFMNGTQVIQAGVVGQLPPNWTIVGSDMKGDIFLRNTSSGDVGMWVMNGTHIAQTVDFGSVALNWTVVGIGDFDGNGSFDILWRDTAGDVAIWLLNGTSILFETSITNLPTSWNIVGTGDYNGDGRSDILWADNSGDVAIWFMNGASVGSVVFYGNVGAAWSVQSLNAD
jgi:hypothetical protein